MLCEKFGSGFYKKNEKIQLTDMNLSAPWGKYCYKIETASCFSQKESFYSIKFRKTAFD
jgi:hypothetical protein